MSGPHILPHEPAPCAEVMDEDSAWGIPNCLLRRGLSLTECTLWEESTISLLLYVRCCIKTVLFSLSSRRHNVSEDTILFLDTSSRWFILFSLHPSSECVFTNIVLSATERRKSSAMRRIFNALPTFVDNMHCTLQMNFHIPTQLDEFLCNCLLISIIWTLILLFVDSNFEWQ